MGYKKSKHYNAVLKYVKEKEIVLQKGAQSIMNGTIQTACEQLANDGKIKREKVKIRFKNGNLNNAWALYVPGIDYNKVIEFERELVNRPFESPLKEHHCYKKDKDITTQHNDGIEIIDYFERKGKYEENNNVIDMKEYVKINNQKIGIKEFNGEKVVTSNDIAFLHNKPIAKVNEVFKRNQHHFRLNRDYFVIKKDDFKIPPKDLGKYFVSNRQKEIYLFTEMGYLMLTKPFKDERSWMVQQELVDTYFKVKQLKTDPATKNIPQVQNIQLYDVMGMMVDEMRSHNDRIAQLENVIGGIASALNK